MTKTSLSFETRKPHQAEPVELTFVMVFGDSGAATSTVYNPSSGAVSTNVPAFRHRD